MDTVIAITASGPRDSDVVGVLRDAGVRVVHRRLDDDVAELLLDRPDVVVVDIPDDRRVRPLLEPLLDVHGIEDVAVLVVVGPAGLTEASRITRLTDFVLRPLRGDELTARVRRPLVSRGRDEDDKLRVGRLLIDLKGYEAVLEGKRLDLTYQEFELLKFLAAHPGQAFTRDQLLARVWGYDYYGGSRTVDIHVRRIRAKLGHPYAGCVKTIRHVGYKWVPDADASRGGGHGRSRGG